MKLEDPDMPSELLALLLGILFLWFYCVRVLSPSGNTCEFFDFSGTYTFWTHGFRLHKVHNWWLCVILALGRNLCQVRSRETERSARL